MRKIRDVLRLHLKGGLSQRQIAAALGISKGVVAKYISLASELGLSWDRKLPQIENNMKIEASISLRRRDEEVKVHGEPDCCNLG